MRLKTLISILHEFEHTGIRFLVGYEGNKRLFLSAAVDNNFIYISNISARYKQTRGGVRYKLTCTHKHKTKTFLTVRAFLSFIKKELNSTPVS